MLFLMCCFFFSDGLQVLIVPKLILWGLALSQEGRSVAVPLLQSARQQQMGPFLEVAGLGPPCALSLPISLLQRVYVSVIMFSVAFSIWCIYTIQKLSGSLTVSKYGPRCPAVIWLPSLAGGAAAAVLTPEWKRVIRQLHYIPLALWTFKCTLLFKDQKVGKRVPGGAADTLPFPKSFCVVPSARYQHTLYSKAA